MTNADTRAKALHNLSFVADMLCEHKSADTPAPIASAYGDLLTKTYAVLLDASDGMAKACKHLRETQGLLDEDKASTLPLETRVRFARGHIADALADLGEP